MSQVFEIVGADGKTALSAGFFKNIESYPGQIKVTPPLTSAKLEGAIARPDAVRGARHIERTSEHVRGGLDKKANMTVGDSLRVQPTPDYETLGLTREQGRELAGQFRRVFVNWAYDERLLQDAEGHYDFGGLMFMSYRNLIGPDAETALVVHYDQRRADLYRTRWATYVTVLDPDRIDTPGEHAADEGVQFGRRLDRNNRMVGFYCRRGHHTDTEVGSEQFDFIPRETGWGRPMGIHWFFKLRGGAQRGINTLITSLKATTLMDKYESSKVERAIIESYFGVYAKSNAGAKAFADNLIPAGATSPGADARLDFYEGAKVKFGPARLAVLPEGDDIEFSAVDSASSNDDALFNQFLRRLASALGISFEQLSNNYSETNYSSARAALLEIWRGIKIHRRLFTRHVAGLIYSAVVEEAIFKGYVKLPAGAPPFQEWRSAYTSAAWIGPGMGWIDPLKEAQANQILIDMKLTSRSRVVAEAGDNWDDIAVEISDEEAYAQELGLDLNPELTAAKAAAEAAAARAEEDPDQDPDQPAPADPGSGED